MKRLAHLFSELDATTSTNAKVEALVRYFEIAPDTDKVWLISMFSQRRPPRVVNYRLLGEWAAEMAGIPEWLFVESYHIVGDYAETLALILPDAPEKDSTYPLSHYMDLLAGMKSKTDAEKKDIVTNAWRELTQQERFIFNKMITGGLRIGVSQKLMTRALAQYSGVDEKALTAHLMGKWDPAATTYETLIHGDGTLADLSRPYPFLLAYALDIPTGDLGDPNDWFVERKWDGIRGQIIVRKGNIYIWTRGEELATDKYPELHPLTTILPHGTVLDAELLAWRDGRPLPFQDMQKRIGRKNVSKKMLNEIPVRAMVYDVLEWQGEDIRLKPLWERREILHPIFTDFLVNEMLIQSELVAESSWDAYDRQRLAARIHDCEGLMLKRRDGIYDVGRKRGNWWKWKTDPYTVDCVMIYAQRGHGRRANMYTDFTFAVWDKDQLVPFAKAYSGLSDEEFEEITRWVGRNTLERFGPVSVVPAVHVFELHFEGIGYSSRHKSGIAVRFPRISRWRKDKKPGEADSIDALKKLIK